MLFDNLSSNTLFREIMFTRVRNLTRDYRAGLSAHWVPLLKITFFSENDEKGDVPAPSNAVGTESSA